MQSLNHEVRSFYPKRPVIDLFQEIDQHVVEGAGHGLPKAYVGNLVDQWMS
jgi:hypothetical protein